MGDSGGIFCEIMGDIRRATAKTPSSENTRFLAAGCELLASPTSGTRLQVSAIF